MLTCERQLEFALRRGVRYLLVAAIVFLFGQEAGAGFILTVDTPSVSASEKPAAGEKAHRELEALLVHLRNHRAMSESELAGESPASSSSSPTSTLSSSGSMYGALSPCGSHPQADEKCGSVAGHEAPRIPSGPVDSLFHPPRVIR